jgi:hypothetical protein
VNRHRRGDAEHLKAASEHLGVLDAHLQRGSLDDILIRDAVSHRLEVAIDAISRVSPELLAAEAPSDWPKDRRNAKYPGSSVRRPRFRHPAEHDQ